ncbi:MAG: hypothetical protein HY298_01330 [Verrucomicrobia bacterium]|nr:hypothetical protein [Verrucomicrobiota bacterium]
MATFFVERYGKIDVFVEFPSELLDNPIVFTLNEHDTMVATGKVEFLPNGNCLWNCKLNEAVELAAFTNAYGPSWEKNSRYLFAHCCKVYVPRDLPISFI